MVRRYLSWYDVELIAGDSMVPNVAFWPLSSVTNPHYLCDSDLVIEVAANAIIGLAFVFYFEDTKVRHIEGMMHTYIASSYFHSQALTITHTQSFVSFPSLHPQNGMLSCFPSMIFNQLLLVKEKIQLLLNTRSMSEKCICTATLNGVHVAVSSIVGTEFIWVRHRCWNKKNNKMPIKTKRNVCQSNLKLSNYVCRYHEYNTVRKYI